MGKLLVEESELTLMALPLADVLLRPLIGDQQGRTVGDRPGRLGDDVQQALDGAMVAVERAVGKGPMVCSG